MHIKTAHGEKWQSPAIVFKMFIDFVYFTTVDVGLLFLVAAQITRSSICQRQWRLIGITREIHSHNRSCGTNWEQGELKKSPFHQAIYVSLED